VDDPYRLSTYAEAHFVDEAEGDRALLRAQEAANTWRNVPLAQRVEVVNRCVAAACARRPAADATAAKNSLSKKPTNQQTNNKTGRWPSSKRPRTASPPT
jgi:acyl-CoA reductase-like NAD-dependent aldehyde dehydrogenase